MESDSMTLTDRENAFSMLPPATGSATINVGPGERILSTFIGAATAVYGLRHLGSLGGIALTVTGGLLLSRGITGYCSVNNAIGRNSNAKIRKTSAMEIDGTFTINKPRSEVYAFWRKLENLPLFMKHLEDVKEEDSVNSTWQARIPGNLGTVTWKAVITEDKPQELLSWASKPGSTIDNAGEVRFTDAPGNGTDIHIRMTYRLPAGDVGTIAGKLFNPAVERMMKEDLRRFKTIMESADISGSPLTASAGITTDTSMSDMDADLAKPKRGRSRKNPDGGTGSSTSSFSSPEGERVQDPEKNQSYIE